jgi:hypothetical protein
MRDYVKAWVIDVDADDGGAPPSHFVNSYCATTEQQAEATRASVVSQLPGQGFPNINYANIYPLYMLLNKSLLLSNFTPSGSISEVKGLEWRNLTIQNAAQFGVDAHYSPKDQGIHPWDGKKGPGRPRGS